MGRILDFFKAMFAENSEVSSTRFMAVSCVFFTYPLTLYCLYRGMSAADTAMLVGVFLTTAFGGKVIQKKYEKNSDDSTPKP